MSDERYPWRVHRPLAEVLAAHRAFLEKVQVIEPGGGYPESTLNEAEAKLGHNLPPDIRTSYSAARFVHPYERTTDHGVDFSFRSPEGMHWVPLCEFAATPGDDWWNAEGLIFGDNLEYVVLMWVRGHRLHKDGIIVLTGIHDFGNLQFVTLARSLTEFLGKVAYFKGIRPGGAFAIEEAFDDAA